jgi:hypothetical protein
MKRIVRFLMGPSLAGLVVSFCFAPRLSPQGGDELDILSISPPSGTTIRAGVRRFQASVQYQLGSFDSATLAVYAEEFPRAAGGCTGSQHQTNGGTSFPIQRGTHTPSVSIPWQGNTPVYSDGGYITIGANFVAPNGRVFRSFGMFPQYCYPFTTGG